MNYMKQILKREQELNPKWMLLLIHEGSSNTTDIERVCNERMLYCKFVDFGNDLGLALEAMYVLATDLSYQQLIIDLTNRGLLKLEE